MHIRKILLLFFVILIIVIQFIRPGRIAEDRVNPNDISKEVLLSNDVQLILKKACYDCHSNNPSYPWYFNIQPAGWFMANHISDGRNELNFSEFAGYPPRRQVSKLLGIINEVEDGEMPLSSYKLIHKDARLHENERKILIDWAERVKENIRAER